MLQRALHAHSLAEAYLYVMASSCPACKKGPLEVKNNRRADAEATPIVIDLETSCKSCTATPSFSFELPTVPTTTNSADPPEINSSNEPSTILDIAQWLTLFRMITEAASRESNKVQARYLGLEAALCLEEAMKFFEDEENDLPPASAFFTDDSRRRLRENPHQFSRQRLVNLRAKLPSTTVMRSNLSSKRKSTKPWWRVWG